MRNLRFYIYTALLVVVALLTIPYFCDLMGILFLSATPILSQLSLYKWVAVGMVLMLVAKRILGSNFGWLETFSHELTHTVVALLLFRRVHSFHAAEDGGLVSTSGSMGRGMIPMSLAPYCLPIFTYLLLLIRPLIGVHGIWIFDILIGLTLAFHLVCFNNQTGRHQTDINRYPLLFAYGYIYLARLINACILLVAFFPGYNVFTSIWRLLCAWYDNLLAIGAWW